MELSNEMKMQKQRTIFINQACLSASQLWKICTTIVNILRIPS